MIETICEDCIYFMDVTYDIGGLYKCKLCSDVETKRVRICTAKEQILPLNDSKKDDTLNEKAIDVGPEPRTYKNGRKTGFKAKMF